MEKIGINQIIHDIRKTRYLRILWIDYPQDILYWIQMDSKQNIPSMYSVRSLQDGLSSGEYEYAPDRWLPAVTLKEYGEADIRCRDRVWDIVKDAVLREPEIYMKSERAQILKETENRTNVRLNNLYKLLGRYWRGGKVPDVFLPDYKNRGKTRNYYDPAAKRSGRKKVEGANGKKLTEEDLLKFSAAIKKYYHTPDKLTLEKVYGRLLRDSYSVKDAEGNLAAPYPPDETPSLSQFLYWHNRHRSLPEEKNAREGGKKYALQFRGGTGKTTDFLLGPGMLSQIDATTADIYLVRQDDRAAIIGRPTMYFLMDAMSRTVMGMHISLAPPSLNEAAMTIINAAEDKTLYCRKYGIEIRPEDWPCMVVPDSLLADRGELESKSADMLVEKLGIKLQNTPPFRGDLKGVIESHFHTINADIKGLPGWVDKDFGERCTEDYRLNARLDIRQFTAIIIECVLWYNRFHYLSDYPRTMDMRQRHVKPIPLKLWEYGMKHLTGGLKVLEKEYLRFSVLPHGEASICRDGIHFKKMVYSCSLAEEEHWYDTARIDGRTRVSVAYDPRNAAHIYLQASPEKMVECTLVEHNGMLGDFSIQEIEQMNIADNDEKKKYEPTERFERNKADERIEAICRTAEAMAPDTKGISHAERIRSIAENLEKEMQAQTIAETCSELAVRPCPAQNSAHQPGSRADPEEEENSVQDNNPFAELMDQLLDEALRT